MASNSWNLFGLDLTALRVGLLNILSNPLGIFENKNNGNSSPPSQFDSSSVSDSVSFADPDRRPDPTRPNNVPPLDLSKIRDGLDGSSSGSSTESYARDSVILDQKFRSSKNGMPVVLQPKPAKESFIFDLIEKVEEVYIYDNEFRRAIAHQPQSRNRAMSQKTTSFAPTPNRTIYLDPLPVPTQQLPKNGTRSVEGCASKQLTTTEVLQVLQTMLNKRAHKQTPEQNKSPREDKESSVAIGAPPIQISLKPKATFQTTDGDASSMPVFKMPEPMSSLPEKGSRGDINQGLRELSKEHLKELFKKFQESKSSEFKPYYGGSKDKDMFLNVAVEKIQSALRSPASGDRVKRALGSLHLDYDGRNAVNELEGLSATKALISKTSQKELSDADKNKIKDQLKSSSAFYEKLEEVGVYLLRDKSKNHASTPATSTDFQTRIFRKAKSADNQGGNIIITS